MADGNGYTQAAAPVSARVRVKYKPRTQHTTKYPINRLPFAGRGPEGRTLWNMPPSSGYGAGCDMGRAGGQAFMKALRATDERLGGSLQMVVMDLIRAGVDLNDAGMKGQIVGFFAYLDQWLYQSAHMFGSSLDDISEQEIERVMTLAANETEEEHSKRYRQYLKAQGFTLNPKDE